MYLIHALFYHKNIFHFIWINHKELLICYKICFGQSTGSHLTLELYSLAARGTHVHSRSFLFSHGTGTVGMLPQRAFLQYPQLCLLVQLNIPEIKT